MSVLVAILGLGFLIFIHECGHFFASLALRMRPRRFYVGFPPAIVKFKRNGIEYGIGAIPLGGFVKIPGMHRPAPADVDHQFARVLEEAPDLAGPFDRLRRCLATGDMEAARDVMPTLRRQVEERKLSPPAQESAEKGLTELEDALGPDAYWRAPSWKRVIAIFAGPGANIALALVLFAILFMGSGGRPTTTVETVADGSPALEAGLRSGDHILSINGESVSATDISRTISSSKGAPLTLTVARGNDVLELGPVSAREIDGVHRLGFVLDGEGIGLLAAIGESFRVTGLVTKEIGAALSRLATGEGRDEIASPVGIVQGSSQAADQSTQQYLWVLALISLSIALLNLLPLLPLDGGHIAFAVVEGIRGRSVGREIYERVSVVGIGLVLLLFFLGLSNDIGRLS